MNMSEPIDDNISSDIISKLSSDIIYLSIWWLIIG